MQCPACANDLKPRQVDDVTVDVCAGGCGGVWFDKHELERFDEEHEPAGELLDIDTDAVVGAERSERLVCPRCDDIVMMRHFATPKLAVEVDECPGCGGFWLDLGELGQLRSLYADGEERRRFIAEWLDTELDEHLQAMHRRTAEQQADADRLARAFRFLCPSAWLPGKQHWGSF